MPRHVILWRMTYSTTRTVQIDRPANEVFAFAADPRNLPRWAIHNVQAVQPGADGAWELQTPRGKGRFIPHCDARFGILDHEFIDAREGRWQVPARAVAIGPRASVYIITLAKPHAMPVSDFEQAMGLMGDELQALKRAVESAG